MNQNNHSGFRDLVSVIAVCGLVLFGALLIAPLWFGQAPNWLGSLKDWLPMAPPEQGKAPQGPTATWTDKEIEASACKHWRP